MKSERWIRLNNLLQKLKTTIILMKLFQKTAIILMKLNNLLHKLETEKYDRNRRLFNLIKGPLDVITEPS
jgi:hypothetical protein